MLPSFTNTAFIRQCKSLLPSLLLICTAGFCSKIDVALQYGTSAAWASKHVPLFECNNANITTAYSFRWQVYRKHIVYHKSINQSVVTEFLPDVSWASPYNTIACSASHHIYEGRWLKDSQVLDDYTRFWFGPYGRPRSYTTWLTNAIHARALATGDFSIAVELLDSLRNNLEAWRTTHWVPAAGCFFQSDVRDGGEDSISGDGCRVSINSVMYGEWQALADIEEAAGQKLSAKATRAKAKHFRQRILKLLWDPQMEFFTGLKVSFPQSLLGEQAIDSRLALHTCRCPGAPEWPPGKLVPVRELLALSTPFYFGLIPTQEEQQAVDYSAQWDQLLDREGFAAEWGPRTAERRHPSYNFSCEHACTWNGPSWPFETARLLSALASFLRSFSRTGRMSPSVWLGLLAQYARAQTSARVPRPTDAAGKPVAAHPWIGESLHPDDGYWLSREYMIRHAEWDWTRGYMYNHATFCDLVITGLVGITPRRDQVLELNPLVDDSLSYFALEGLLYHGHLVDVYWDREGTQYQSGKGLQIVVDGRLAARSLTIARLSVPLPAS